jgi:hypothetical protein
MDHGDADTICIEDLKPLSNISTESALIFIEQILGRVSWEWIDDRPKHCATARSLAVPSAAANTVTPRPRYHRSRMR